MSYNRRCSICNAVDNEDIETAPGDYKENTPFTADPGSHLHFVCIPCYEEIQEVLQEWEYEDWEKENS